MYQIKKGEKIVFWLKGIVLNRCEEEKEEKCEENRAIFRSMYLAKYLAGFPQIWYVKLCSYMKGIKK